MKERYAGMNPGKFINPIAHHESCMRRDDLIEDEIGYDLPRGAATQWSSGGGMELF